MTHYRNSPDQLLVFIPGGSHTQTIRLPYLPIAATRGCVVAAVQW